MLIQNWNSKFNKFKILYFNFNLVYSNKRYNNWIESIKTNHYKNIATKTRCWEDSAKGGGAGGDGLQCNIGCAVLWWECLQQQPHWSVCPCEELQQRYKTVSGLYSTKSCVSSLTTTDASLQQVRTTNRRSRFGRSTWCSRDDENIFVACTEFANLIQIISPNLHRNLNSKLFLSLPKPFISNKLGSFIKGSSRGKVWGKYSSWEKWEFWLWAELQAPASTRERLTYWWNSW